MGKDLKQKIEERLLSGKGNLSIEKAKKMIRENYDLAKRRGARTPAEFEKEIREFAHAGRMSNW